MIARLHPRHRGSRPTTSWRPTCHAQGLIRQLIDISGGLSSGLDVNAIGGAMLSAVHDELPVVGARPLRAPRRDADPVSTARRSPPTTSTTGEALAVEAWARTDTMIDDTAFAFPLGDTAVVGGSCPTASKLDTFDLPGKIGRCPRGCRPTPSGSTPRCSSPSSATAPPPTSAAGSPARCTTASPRTSPRSATWSTRWPPDRPPPAAGRAARRAARPDHATWWPRSASPCSRLRTSVGESESLGAAISSVARNLSEVSGIPIQVTLDEHTTRLRPEVEAELFRITQEAMNNAIKHAQATAIERALPGARTRGLDHHHRRRPRPAAGAHRLPRPEDHAASGPG